ncbi:MAG: UvrD-helicase domain-containing protein [Firmicutes bacterium]|nr:UvrD-helicase domain-containing protein [Bacillota bacterium]
MASFLIGLNSAQKEAVLTTDGPLMVIAGAGSGKTRVITHRLAHLIHTAGVAPEAILAVTFTNKAAREMKSRVMQLVGESAQSAWVCTFHSACVRILREYITHLGYSESFAIIDDNDQRALFREILAGTGRDSSDVNPYLWATSRFKTLLISPQEALTQAVTRSEHDYAQVYDIYARRLQQINAVDFDDLLYLTVRLFREHPAVLEEYRQRFSHIMVDEYQDTNHAQYILIRLLADRHRNLCVVGDDGQSIYGFRLADITNILNFQRDYPEAKVIKLEQNYRSTQTILKPANAVISENRHQLEKRLWTHNPKGDPISLCFTPTDKDEARFVAQEVQFLASRYRFNDMAVLYRSKAQSRLLEEQFVRLRIPYRVVGGFRFYDRAEVRDTLAYLRLLINQEDNVSLLRVINTPRRGIGDKALAKLTTYATEQDISLFRAVSQATEAGVKGKTGKAAEQFAATIDELSEKVSEFGVGELMIAIFERTGYRAMYKESNKGDLDRLETLDEFLSMAKEYDSRHGPGRLQDFLDYIALLTDIDTLRDEADQVTLMTVHAAKGLEYPVVFITGMEEGIFPHYRALDDGALEEERRLFYVGLTRAKEKLYLTAAQERLRMGAPVACEPSCFLDEIPKDCLEKLAYY